LYFNQLASGGVEMVRLDEGQWNYWRNSLRAYLQGKKTINWIVGVLDISSIEQFDQMINELMPYGPYVRKDDIPKIRRRILQKRFS
jgi:hypothetical protein